jgi:hypothetical protein
MDFHPLDGKIHRGALWHQQRLCFGHLTALDKPGLALKIRADILLTVAGIKVVRWIASASVMGTESCIFLSIWPGFRFYRVSADERGPLFRR